jgi:hypothetical protein
MTKLDLLECYYVTGIYYLNAFAKCQDGIQQLQSEYPLLNSSFQIIIHTQDIFEIDYLL